MEVVVASLNEKKLVKGQARVRILSMNLTRRPSKSQWRGLHDTFLDICIFFSVAVVVVFNNTAPAALNERFYRHLLYGYNSTRALIG